MPDTGASQPMVRTLAMGLDKANEWELAVEIVIFLLAELLVFLLGAAWR